MFEYFQSYPWNLAMLVALQSGAVMSEVDEVCRPLRDVSDRDADGATDSGAMWNFFMEPKSWTGGAINRARNPRALTIGEHHLMHGGGHG